MTLLNCPECKTSISDQAFYCPKCGYVMKSFFGGRGRSWGYEWKSQTELFGWPLIHVTIGFDKNTGRLLVSRGIIAIGQFAVGVFTLAQFGIGIVFGLGQFMAGLIAFGQIALGVLFGFGQIASGQTAIGQFAFGQYVRAMVGVGEHIWTMKVKDPIAVEYFRQLFDSLKLKIG